MKIIIDATALDLYPFGKPGFYGGTELYIHRLAHGLARTHLVHVVTADLESEEQRGEKLFYWPKAYHPTNADAVVMVHNLENISPYSADLLILASNGLGAFLGPNDEFAKGLDAVACFSQCHIDLLCKRHPKVKKELCVVTGLGVDLAPYTYQGPPNYVGGTALEPVVEYPPAVAATGMKIPDRMLYANDPQRGLWKTLNIFEHVQKQVPTATLHVAYNWQKVFNNIKWYASAMAEELWECYHRIPTMKGVRDIGELEREDFIAEQLMCQIHVYPSDPPNVGSQIHGLTQMECAAAGCALVLSDIEAFPEVFGEAATILPVPGAYVPGWDRRCDEQDWAEVVVELMKDKDKYREASRRSRALAEVNTWEHVIHKWNLMLESLRHARIPA